MSPTAIIKQHEGSDTEPQCETFKTEDKNGQKLFSKEIKLDKLDVKKNLTHRLGSSSSHKVIPTSLHQTQS